MRYRTILPAVLLLPLTGCLPTFEELRASDPVRMAELPGAADVLSFCAMREIEKEGLPVTLRRLSDPVTHRNELAGTRMDIVTGANAPLFEVTFIPSEPGRTHVEFRDAGLSAKGLVDDAWPQIERCSKQLGQKTKAASR